MINPKNKNIICFKNKLNTKNKNWLNPSLYTKIMNPIKNQLLTKGIYLWYLKLNNNINKKTKLIKMIIILLSYNSMINKRINIHLNKIATKQITIIYYPGKNPKRKVQNLINPNHSIRLIRIEISKSLKITIRIIKRFYLKIKIKSLKY